jgi:hypothetical protein
MPERIHHADVIQQFHAVIDEMKKLELERKIATNFTNFTKFFFVSFVEFVAKIRPTSPFPTGRPTAAGASNSIMPAVPLVARSTPTKRLKRSTL